MRGRNLHDEMDDEEIIGLKLSVPERDVIVTSSKVADRGLQDRVRSSPPRQVITFSMEELEDLHRGLAFDADQTLDSKRRKTLGKVLRKIEEIIDETDELDEIGDLLGEWDDQAPVPQSAEELFAAIVGSPPMPVDERTHCRIALTADQRNILRGMDTIGGDIHKMLRDDSPDEQEIAISPRQFLTLTLALAEALALSKDKKRRQSLEQIARRLSHGAFAKINSAARNDQLPEGPQSIAYQLKITLDGSKPAIWRRVVVPNGTLAELHRTVQNAMGWMDCHMHMFEYGGDCFSDPQFELDGNEYDETQVYVSQLVDDGCKTLRYCYDFGDDWVHTIKIEKTLELTPNEQLPRCIKGGGACPPEDCGGIWGYYEFLEAIRDPKHERHDEMVEWAGDNFNADAFDIDETNKALASGPVNEFDS